MSVSEDNSSEQFTTSVDINIVVEASFEILSSSNDADNDGISDADEGYADSDQRSVMMWILDVHVLNSNHFKGISEHKTLKGLAGASNSVKNAELCYKSVPWKKLRA